MRLQSAMDRLAVERGLSGGLRDFVILSILHDEQPKTQADLGQLAGVDKTTLTSVLDRLEREGLVERRLVPCNRRVRTPVITDRGREVRASVESVRHSIVEGLGFPDVDLSALRELILKLDQACDAAGLKLSGSCVR